jgi:RNA-directed DNA polymerase
MGKPAATDRPCLRSLSHSFTLDFIIGFEREDDARRVLAVLRKRLGRFGLTLHPDKTRLLPFGRPPQAQHSSKGLATFDFLGFTFYWARSRQGRWGMWCKTRRASLRRAKQALYDWCRRHPAPAG